MKIECVELYDPPQKIVKLKYKDNHCVFAKASAYGTNHVRLQHQIINGLKSSSYATLTDIKNGYFITQDGQQIELEIIGTIENIEFVDLKWD